MAAKLIVKKLNSAIAEKKSQDLINDHIDVLTEMIIDAANEPLFYALPFDQIKTKSKNLYHYCKR